MSQTNFPEHCESCGNAVVGSFVVEEEMQGNVPVVAVYKTPDCNYNVCDGCNKLVCFDCCCCPMLGYCSDCCSDYRGGPTILKDF